MTEASSVVIVDGQDVFNIRKYLKEMGFNNAKINYEALKKILEETVVKKFNLQRAEKTLTLCSMIPDSEPHVRFIEKLKIFGYTVHTIDHWRTCVPFFGLTSVSDLNRKNSIPILSPLISYMIGVLSSRPNPQVIVVSGSFGLFDAMADFTENHGGKVVLTFFQRFLDPRWGVMGFNDKLRFYDLEPHSEELLGIDLAKAIRKPAIGI